MLQSLAGAAGEHVISGSDMQPDFRSNPSPLPPSFSLYHLLSSSTSPLIVFRSLISSR